MYILYILYIYIYIIHILHIYINTVYIYIYIYCESLHTGRISPSPPPRRSRSFSQAAKMVNVARLPKQENQRH